jgi:hypothetical protein
MITRKALEILENNLVLTRNVNRQYDDSFAVQGAKIGSTLRIRLPYTTVIHRRTYQCNALPHLCVFLQTRLPHALTHLLL